MRVSYYQKSYSKIIFKNQLQKAISKFKFIIQIENSKFVIICLICGKINKKNFIPETTSTHKLYLYSRISKIKI